MKKIYFVMAFLIMTGFAFGQISENPRAELTKMKVSSKDALSLPKFACNATKGADTIGWEFFNTFFDNAVYYWGPCMGDHIDIEGTPYGCINRIYQEYYFSEVELSGAGAYQINSVAIYFSQLFINNITGTASVMKVYLNNLNADSTYTKLDSTTFTVNDVDTANFFTVIDFPNHPAGITASGTCLGIGVKLVDDGGSFKANLDTAAMATDVMPAAPKFTSFWATDSSAYAFFYDYHQMITMFPIADNSAGVVGADKYFDGMQLSQNYPNPSVDGSTTISYAVNKEMNVSLQIIDVNGKVVDFINEGVKPAGTYQINLSKKLSKGVYYYSLIGNGQFLTKKMVIE